MDGFVDPFVPGLAWPQDAMFIGPSWPCGGASALADPAGTYTYLGAQVAPDQDADFHLQDGSSTALVSALELHQQFLSAHLPDDDVNVTQEEGLSFEVNSALMAGSTLGPVLSAPCAVSLADSAPVVCSSNDSSGGSEQSGLPPPRFLVLGEQPAAWPSAFPRISSLAGEETSRSFGFGAVSDNDLLRGSSCVADVNKYPQLGNARLHDDVEFNTGKMLSFTPGLDFGDLQLSQKELSGLRHLNSGHQLSSFDATGATRNPEQSSNEASGGGTGRNAPPFMALDNGAAGNGAPKPRVRARRGQATDPHSIAERLRREKISDRMKNLQELVPNSNRTDKASMLDEIIEYVKFLQLQVKVLSMSRLGATEAVVPLLTQSQTESSGGLLLSPRSGSGSGRQQQARGGSLLSPSEVRDGAAFEQEVAQLMESDMTTAMQYLQSKGLCLMPVALASAISGQKGASSAAVQRGNGDAKEMLRAVKPLASPIHGR